MKIKFQERTSGLQIRKSGSDRLQIRKSGSDRLQIRQSGSDRLQIRKSGSDRLQIRKSMFRKSMRIAIAAGIALIILLQGLQMNAQIAKDGCKFIGNIIAGSVPSDFDTYWNQVTPENAGKWGSAEPTRNNMSWYGLNTAYNYAKSKGFPFKWHTFVWGQQQPSWITSLTPEEQKEEVEEWIKLYSEKYPETDFVDVVNEALHAPPSYSSALGGAGSTGWDWVVWAFKKARQYLPNARLHINDYGILNSTFSTGMYIKLINILLDSNLIDGIGLQAHGLESTDINTIKDNLKSLAATGLPIYITEYDVNIADDQQQSTIYQEQFPVFWNHRSVNGVTLWGYKQGQIWKTDAYLVKTDGTERPALTWLKSFVKGSLSGYSCLSGMDDLQIIKEPEPSFYPNPVSNGCITFNIGKGISEISVLDINGSVIKNFNVSGQSVMNFDMDWDPGTYIIQFKSRYQSYVQKLIVL
jgi:endo-1,4-beta-xylanase